MSIIVKGISAENDTEFGTKFGEVCNFLAPTDVPTRGETFCINRERNIYRISLENKDIKEKILSNAKNMKDHQLFKDVFISRVFIFLECPL